MGERWVLQFLVAKLSQEIQLDHHADLSRGHRCLRPQPALGDSGQKLDGENQYRLHSREDQQNGGAGRKIVYWPDFGSELVIRDPQARYIHKRAKTIS